MSSSESIEVIDADGVKENNFAVARELAETQALCRNVTNMTQYECDIIVVVMSAGRITLKTPNMGPILYFSLCHAHPACLVS